MCLGFSLTVGKQDNTMPFFFCTRETARARVCVCVCVCGAELGSEEGG